MKILICYPNLKNIFTGSNVYYFLEELARQVECKFVGLGYPDSLLQDKSDKTGQEWNISQPLWDAVLDEVKRLEPVTDKWNLSPYTVDRIKKLMLYNLKRFYGDDGPDWVLGSRIVAKEIDRDYKLCRWVGDIHVTPNIQIEVANQELDLLLLRCLHSKYVFPTIKDFRSVFGVRPFTKWIERGHCVEVSDDWYISQLKTNYMLWPPSVEPTYFKPIDESEKKYDVSMIASVGGFYPLRQNIKRELFDLAAKHKWKAVLRKPPTRDRQYRLNINMALADPELRKKWFLGEDYARALAESKVFIFGSSLFRYALPKYFEAMGSGALVMADKPFHAEDLHFKPGYNFIEINEDNWMEKLEYILDDDQLRETIARRGYETIIKYHTNEVRVKELVKKMESI